MCQVFADKGAKMPVGEGFGVDDETSTSAATSLPSYSIYTANLMHPSHRAGSMPDLSPLYLPAGY